MSRDQLQLKEMESQLGMAAPEVDVDAEHRPETSRRASNAGLRREAVQMRGGDATKDASGVHEAATAGVQGPGSQLPHRDLIQQSFGRHDISHVQAHTGGQAAEASRAIGAEAYAHGDQIAFAQSPDLHTAAHEAAHVVQQSQGVNLYGGVGQAGDAHERNADAVADRVVKGESAEDLLGPVSENRASAAPAVQRKETKEQADPKQAHQLSDIRSNQSLSSSLRLLAKHFHDARAEVLSLVDGQHDTEAGINPAAESVIQIFNSLRREAMHVALLLRDAHVDKAIAQTAAPEVKLVLGAFNRFGQVFPKAHAFAEKIGDKSTRFTADEIKSFVDGYTAKIGFDKDVTLAMDTKNPEGPEKDVRKGAITDHIDAAVSAAASVNAGNGGDLDRLKLHVAEIEALVKDQKGAVSAHKKELAALTAALKDVKKAHPDLAKTIDSLLAELKALK